MWIISNRQSMPRAVARGRGWGCCSSGGGGGGGGSCPRLRPLAVVVLVGACRPSFPCPCRRRSPWCRLPVPVPVVVLPRSLPHAPPFSPRNPPREQLLAAVVGVPLYWWWWWSSSSWSWSWSRRSPVPRRLVVFSPRRPRLRAVVVSLPVSAVVSFPFSAVVAFSFRRRFVSFLRFFPSSTAPSTLRARGSQARAGPFCRRRCRQQLKVVIKKALLVK